MPYNSREVRQYATQYGISIITRDESESVTIQANVNLSSGVTAESNANSELNSPDNNVFSGIRHSTRVRSFPNWHKDYVM